MKSQPGGGKEGRGLLKPRAYLVWLVGREVWLTWLCELGLAAPLLVLDGAVATGPSSSLRFRPVAWTSAPG
jgi:hypothetical protein